jgi:hypothetical protein
LRRALAADPSLERCGEPSDQPLTADQQIEIIERLDGLKRQLSADTQADADQIEALVGVMALGYGRKHVPATTSTTLFNGAVPPNGFMIQQSTGLCYVNDNGPANSGAGFYFAEPAFITPPGYKPIGAVSVRKAL